MKSKAEIERLIQEDMNKREQRTNPDPKDFLIRRYILEFDHSQSEAEKIYDITIKKVLLLTYPEYFEIAQGKFQPRASLEESKRATLYQAFGYTPPTSSSAPVDVEIQPNQFDFQQLDLLFAQDKECVWLALKEAIPVGTYSRSVPVGKSKRSVLNDNRIPYTTIDKVQNYLDLAKAFQAGSSSQIGQTVRRVSGIFATTVQNVTKNVGIDLTPKASTQIAKIVSPGYESGMTGCMTMIDRAIAYAGADPASLALLEQELKPSTNSRLKKTAYDTVLLGLSSPEIQTLLQSDLMLTLDESSPDNLGHSITNTAMRLLPPYSLPILTKLKEQLSAIEANKLGQQATKAATDMDAKMPTTSIRGTSGQLDELEKIINCNQTPDASSSKGQRLAVAHAVQAYLQGDHSNWLIICDVKRCNPDWNTPESLMKMFGSSPLKTLVEQIESTDPNAKEATRLYTYVEELTKNLSPNNMATLSDAMLGKPNAIRPATLYSMKNDIRKAFGAGTEKCVTLESILDGISEYAKANAPAAPVAAKAGPG